jgi:ribonucleotide monophosphatase NagD (HAD superfamily)
MSTTPEVVIAFLSVLQDKAQPLCLLTNQPWAAQRIYAAHFLLGSPLPFRFLF